MTTITQNVCKELFNYRDGKLYWRHDRPHRRTKGRAAGSVNSYGYCRVKIEGKEYRAHRLIWLYHHGEWPKYNIDHINHEKLDNRIENLRDVSHQENHKNQKIPKNNKSGYMGVAWEKETKKWRAQVKLQNKKVHLGLFTDKEDAASVAYAARHQLGFHSNHGSS